jgi:small subunit ribosomal protein S4
MSRYTGPKCRLCRREKTKLFLKGARCDSAKCAMERPKGDSPPGVQSFRRGKVTPYGLQLREKQKLKRFYGVLEKQFRRYYAIAERMKGNIGTNLLTLFERRLDNVVCKLGFVPNRASARQMIAHGNITVNGRRVSVPSIILRQNDVVGVKDKDRIRKAVKENIEAFSGEVPGWVSRDESALTGKVVALPSREDVSVAVEVQLIVELCSR